MIQDIISEVQTEVVKPLTEWQVSYLQRGDVDKAMILQNSIDVVNRMCAKLIAYEDAMVQIRSQIDVMKASTNDALTELHSLRQEIEQNKFFIQK